MSPRAKAVIGIIVAVVALLSVYLVVLKIPDSCTRYNYATFADLKRDIEVKAASVRASVPPSARDFTAWYDVDDSTQALEFTFDRADEPQVLQSFRPAAGDVAAEVERRVRFYRRKNLLPKRSEFGSAAFTPRDGRAQYLIVDQRNERAYYASEAFNR